MKKEVPLTKRESNKINCREKLLKVSRRLFTKNGYDKTTMDDIAEKAGVSKATVYNYFPNKESLLIGTVNEVLDQEAAFVTEEEYSSLSGKKKLDTMLTFLVNCIRKYPDISRRITYLNSCSDSTLFGKANRMVSILTTIVDNCKLDGSFKPDADTDTIVDILVGILYIVLFQWTDIDKISKATMQERLDEYVGIVLNRYWLL